MDRTLVLGIIGLALGVITLGALVAEHLRDRRRHHLAERHFTFFGFHPDKYGYDYQEARHASGVLVNLKSEAGRANRAELRAERQYRHDEVPMSEYLAAQVATKQAEQRLAEAMALSDRFGGEDFREGLLAALAA